MAEASERESTDDPKAWELEIRKRIRDSMEAKNVAQFPRPVHERIPNFVGAPIAADELAELEEFRTAECAKVNPDTPQNQVRFLTLTGAQSAWEMLREEDFTTHITTSCSHLDNILGGGISCREVTEIGGVPGIGKTQLGIQLAVNVQIPLDYGGLEGKAIYIDTEGSFMVERALQIAEGCVENMLTSSYFKSSDGPANQGVLDPKQFLANIFYFRICSYTEQIGLVNHLDKFISENQNVKIVIIDSITFHFRQDFEDLALRTRVLSSMALKLMKLAQKFNLAVILLNQVTTKYVDGSYQLALALGDSWSHASTNRLILYWNDNERCAYIDKSPSLPSASASYAVTAKGIRNGVSTCKKIKLV